jgi:hypothetical protein
LEGGVHPKSFTIKSDATRNAISQRDPWSEFFKIGKPLRK